VIVRWLSLFHLVGLPELKLFGDPSAKARALDENVYGKIGGLVGFLIRPRVLISLWCLPPLAILFLRTSFGIFGLTGTVASYADGVLML